jgi:hypothetical protein
LASEDYTTQQSRRYRPARRPSSSRQEQEATALTHEFVGMALAYGSTLLFIGYEVNGQVEITVYPRYRFSSDDRVQGHLGYVRAPFGTPWEEILPEVDRVFEEAEENYRRAVTLRSQELRAHGARFDSAYDTICEIFRECWHGFSLRLRREGGFEKGGVEFSGNPPGPVLAVFRGKPYTVMVYPSGSITMLNGDRREVFERG